MVSITTISEKTGLSYTEAIDLLKKRGVLPRSDGKYSFIDLDRVFDSNFKVRDVNAPILRTLETHQDIKDAK